MVPDPGARAVGAKILSEVEETNLEEVSRNLVVELSWAVSVCVVRFC